MSDINSTALSHESIATALAKALSEIKSAKNLDELKTVRINHAGDKFEIALANRTIGSLQGAERLKLEKELVRPEIK